ncbi:hypothetical protein [Devosia sp. RR2S18]|uniref:hypothetical protein n=1 Tax=Devosia rhizosphaerae TaxID=3049774 RepID=UPI0025421365|nr:hypothetical protein [Devosia sp. RR2S18]WIJ26973.1 hypothetical protein QOV41_09590 [Devosia sp. RR2S18]
MQRASISQWTLAYFGCSLAVFLAALGLIAAGFGYPADALAGPRTLIVVHMLAIGWLTLLMFGAMFQFLPVLVGRDLVWPRLPPVALLLIATGLVVMLTGFAGLDGMIDLPAQLLPTGGLLLLCGFSTAAAVLMATLLQGQSLPLPACFVAVALLSVLLTALVGESLASALTGVFGGDFALALVTHGIPLHAGLGLGGWLTFAAMGVSYRLVSMFLVAPERGGRLPQIAFWSGVLGGAGLGGAFAILLARNMPAPPAVTFAALAGFASVGAYLGDIITLYRSRRRKALELHMRAAIAAFSMLGLAALVLVIAAAAGSERGVVAGVYILVLGWLSGLSLAMLFKIIPFLTWLECFAPVMGRTPTPRVQDLVCERRALPIFAGYFIAVLVGATGLFMEEPHLLRVAAAAQLIVAILLSDEFRKARRLHHLPAEWTNWKKPRLFLPTTPSRMLP